MLGLDRRRMWPKRSLLGYQLVGGGVGRFVVKRGCGGFGRRRKDRRAMWLRSVRCRIGGALHLTNERLRGVLDVPNELASAPGNFGELIGAEQEQGHGARDGHIGDGEHAEGFFPKLLNGTRPGNTNESFGRCLY